MNPAFINYLPKKNKNKLYVFFHGAVDQEKTMVPHFVGGGFRKYLDGSTLHIADETLLVSPSLRTGFYLGLVDDLAKEIARYIEEIVDSAGYQRVILFGSSGGGFIALTLSELLGDCVTVVNSAATSVRNHPNKKIYGDFVSHVVAASGLGEDEYFSSRRSCLRQNFKPIGMVKMICNLGDVVNNDRHLFPFLMQYDIQKDSLRCGEDLRISENLTILVNDFGKGHKYPPVPYLVTLLRNA